MQRLNLTHDLEWIDLPRDVRVQVQPVTTALIYAARRDPAIAALPADADQELVALVMGQSIARLAIVAWRASAMPRATPSIRRRKRSPS